MDSNQHFSVNVPINPSTCLVYLNGLLQSERDYIVIGDNGLFFNTPVPNGETLQVVSDGSYLIPTPTPRTAVAPGLFQDNINTEAAIRGASDTILRGDGWISGTNRGLQATNAGAFQVTDGTLFQNFQASTISSGSTSLPGIDVNALFESYQELLVKVEDLTLKVEELLEEREK